MLLLRSTLHQIVTLVLSCLAEKSQYHSFHFDPLSNVGPLEYPTEIIFDQISAAALFLLSHNQTDAAFSPRPYEGCRSTVGLARLTAIQIIYTGINWERL